MEKNDILNDNSRAYGLRLAKLDRIYSGDRDNNLGAYAKGVNKNQNHLDEKGSASRYLDSVLVALKPGMTYRDASETRPYMPFTKGANLGTIYSYVVDKQGRVWWQIDNRGPFANRFVLSSKGAFDGIVAENTSSGLKIETQKQALAEQMKSTDAISNAGKAIVTGAGDIVSGIGKTLSGLGKNFGFVIGAVVVIILVVSFAKLKNV